MGEPCGRRRPLHPRLLALLLIAAGSAGAQLQSVSGVRGGSVLLSPALPNSSEVRTAEWYFMGGTGKKNRVAEFGPKGFERPDPHDRFKQRLEMPNATALRIGGLEPGDSGVYGVWIKYNSTTEVEYRAFNLSVYGEQLEPALGGYWEALLGFAAGGERRQSPFVPGGEGEEKPPGICQGKGDFPGAVTAPCSTCGSISCPLAARPSRGAGGAGVGSQ
uniref:Immunoglobulin V-set domain-containing protein n=1 Tax=Anas zonorhyncha TaxID=75864 RepID=A0A8B9U2R1_9AVES